MSRSFYTAVTQQVLFFGAESWVLTGKMESDLDTFQGRVARRLTGRQPCRGNDGKWFYPYLAGALKESGVVRVRTLILRRQNTVAQFIVMRPILGLCEMAERRRGKRPPWRWCKQTGIDWKSAMEKTAAQGGANEAEPEMTGSGSESDSSQYIVQPYSVSGGSMS